jgi:hypothetical protein
MKTQSEATKPLFREPFSVDVLEARKERTSRKRKSSKIVKEGGMK